MRSTVFFEFVTEQINNQTTFITVNYFFNGFCY